MKSFVVDLACPICHKELSFKKTYYKCEFCNVQYDIKYDIPILICTDNNIEEKDCKICENQDFNKEYIVEYYTRLSSILEYKFGRFIKFMNCGYISDDNHQYSFINSDKKELEKPSVKLLFEVIGQVDCSNKRIVDVGCGRGGNVYCINKYFTPKYTIGLDICLANIQACIQNRNIKTFFCVADAEYLPLLDSCCDIVINIESSFHYSNIFKFYDEAYRVLDDNGFFLYADVFLKDKTSEIEDYFSKLGFQIEQKRDITLNTVLAFENLKDNLKSSRNRDNTFFSECFDSINYKRLKRGECIYMLYTLKK